MARLVANRDGGTSNEYGTFAALSRLLTGNVTEGFAVVPNGTPNMTVLVNPGSGVVNTGTYPSSYSYFVSHDTVGGESVTIATAAASPRIDYIVAYVNKSVTPSAVSTYVNNTNAIFNFASVAGTPAGSPVVPTVAQIQTAIGAANPYFILAQVAVGASVTTITSPNLTDLRVFVAPISTGPGTVYKASLATAAGELGGTWKAITPSFSGVSPGTGFLQLCRYMQTGKTIIMDVFFILGSGGSASGISIALPVTGLIDVSASKSVGTGLMIKNGGSQYPGMAYLAADGVTCNFYYYNVSGSVISSGGVTSSLPFTWAQYDRISFQLIYEAA